MAGFTINTETGEMFKSYRESCLSMKEFDYSHTVNPTSA